MFAEKVVIYALFQPYGNLVSSYLQIVEFIKHHVSAVKQRILRQYILTDKISTLIGHPVDKCFVGLFPVHLIIKIPRINSALFFPHDPDVCASVLMPIAQRPDIIRDPKFKY